MGLPGETVRIEQGRVQIDGQLLNEPYLKDDSLTLINGNSAATYEITLPDDKYFVLGDNRDHSSDSRDGWLVPINYIVGRSAVTIYAQN